MLKVPIPSLSFLLFIKVYIVYLCWLGKTKLKFELRSYEEMVVNPMKQMNEDNHLLNYYKKRALEESKQAKVYHDSFSAVSDKLRKTQEENRIVRQMTKAHHEENREKVMSDPF